MQYILDNPGRVFELTIEHLQLVFSAILIAALIGIPLGILKGCSQLLQSSLLTTMLWVRYGNQGAELLTILVTHFIRQMECRLSCYISKGYAQAFFLQWSLQQAASLTGWNRHQSADTHTTHTHPHEEGFPSVAATSSAQL